MKNSQKLLSILCLRIFFFFFLYIQKWIQYQLKENANDWSNKTGEIWASMKNSQDGMGVRSMSDLILKEIYSICRTKNPTKEQIKEKFDNLSKDELNAKSSKEVYVKNMVMSTVIKRCIGEKKEANEK